MHSSEQSLLPLRLATRSLVHRSDEALLPLLLANGLSRHSQYFTERSSRTYIIKGVVRSEMLICSLTPSDSGLGVTFTSSYRQLGLLAEGRRYRR